MILPCGQYLDEFWQFLTQPRQVPVFDDYLAIGLPEHLARLVTGQLTWRKAVAGLSD
jgi:hypothetical protein